MIKQIASAAALSVASMAFAATASAEEAGSGWFLTSFVNDAVANQKNEPATVTPQTKSDGPQKCASGERGCRKTSATNRTFEQWANVLVQMPGVTIKNPDALIRKNGWGAHRKDIVESGQEYRVITS